MGAGKSKHAEAKREENLVKLKEMRVAARDSGVAAHPPFGKLDSFIACGMVLGYAMNDDEAECFLMQLSKNAIRYFYGHGDILS